MRVLVRRYLFLILVGAGSVCWSLQLFASSEPASATIHLAIPAPPSSGGYKFFNSLYQDLFSRVGYQVELVSMSGMRARLQGEVNIDGQVGRVAEYQDQADKQIKVPEIIVPIYFAAYASKPNDFDAIAGWQSLASLDKTIAYKHGSIIPELKLAEFVAKTHHDPITHISQGLLKLQAGRADLVVGLVTEIEPYLQSERFADIERIAVLSKEHVYLYLHDRHARLIPSLVTHLRTMKKQNLIEAYWRDAGLPVAMFN